jgi:hypothetical protein
MNAVPRLWSAGTLCVILASGPSLTCEDVDAVRGRAKVIAVKDAIKLAPWADVFYGAGGDTRGWWAHNAALVAGFPGLRFTLDPKMAAYATVLQNTGFSGLERQPTGLRTGKNSGFQALNLALHLGATRILLLGYDMKSDRGRDHFCGNHPHAHAPIPFDAFRDLFPSIVEPLQAAGVDVVNCTPNSALTCFPTMSLSDALDGVPA